MVFASGTFSITAFCDVNFTKKDGKTLIKGSIAFVFWDPYDWHNEFGGVFIPEKRVYWDKEANLLVENKMAPPSGSLTPAATHICCAYGITLSQFFLESECFSQQLAEEQIEILKRWNKMTKLQQKKLADFIDSVC